MRNFLKEDVEAHPNANLITVRGARHEGKLFDRLLEAKIKLEPVQSQYRVVFEADIDNPCSILAPDPNWMACALAGDILPPVEVYHQIGGPVVFEHWKLDKDSRPEQKLDEICEDLRDKEVRYRLKALNDNIPRVENSRWFMKSQFITNGHVLHEKTIPAMTEEEAIEYLIVKDIPPHVWQDNSGNRPKFKICKREQVPTDRNYRYAWGLAA